MREDTYELTQEEKVQEIKYRLGKLVYSNLLQRGYITEEQFKRLRERLIDETHTVIGELERGAPWVKNE